MNTVIVDTGVIYAMADVDDSWHKRVISHLNNASHILIAPITVLVETAYLMNTYLGIEAEQKLLMSVVHGELKCENITFQDVKRSLELIKEYSDANIGFADASIVAVAERLKIDRILTTDRRHFAMIRPKSFKSFTLLP